MVRRVMSGSVVRAIIRGPAGGLKWRAPAAGRLSTIEQGHESMSASSSMASRRQDLDGQPAGGAGVTPRSMC